jgi:hypothetical protein
MQEGDPGAVLDNQLAVGQRDQSDSVREQRPRPRMALGASGTVVVWKDQDVGEPEAGEGPDHTAA